MENLAKPRTDTAAPASDTPSAPAETKSADNLKESTLYATYEIDNAKPYLAEYFGIGDVWNNPELSYKEEVSRIDSYLKGEISDKTLANSTEAVKTRVKQLEKLAGIAPEASPALRVQQLAAFADYLSKLTDIKLKVKLDG